MVCISPSAKLTILTIERQIMTPQELRKVENNHVTMRKCIETLGFASILSS